MLQNYSAGEFARGLQVRKDRSLIPENSPWIDYSTISHWPTTEDDLPELLKSLNVQMTFKSTFVSYNPILGVRNTDRMDHFRRRTIVLADKIRSRSGWYQGKISECFNHWCTILAEYRPYLMVSFEQKKNQF